ncbi:MAG: sigma-70 family RNA polymerase sigma factor [Clostridia bacterium]|nr:sigma-70 family RNA polymerase sigma factor [Clostridia bacterium]
MDAAMEGTAEQTLETIWQVCRERMWREAYKILGSRADSEDAVMDAVERIARNLHKFRYLEDGELIALSVIYTRHTAIDIYNRKKTDPVPVEDITMEETVEDPAEKAILGDLEDLICRLLPEMPEAMRDVLNLHLHYGLSIGEIAESLDISGGAVRTRLSRGRKWLKDRLAEKGVDVYG